MPKAVDSHQRRREITDAAARLIARGGFGAVSMRAVAAEAGWSTGVLTHWFRDKRELLRATLEDSLERRRQMGSDGHDDPLVATLLRTLPLDTDSHSHWLVTMAFCAEASGDNDLALTQAEAYRDHRRTVARLVERQGWARGDEAAGVAERLIAAANGVAVQALFDPASWSADRQQQALIELVEALRP